MKFYLLHYYGAKETEIVFSEKNIEEYEKVYNGLFQLEVAESEMLISIKLETNEDDDDIIPRVYATDSTLRENSTELQQFWQNLMKESDELKNMTPEELKKHTFTLEDLRKELGLNE